MEKELKTFKNYTDKYDHSDKLISLKIAHSIRVSKLCSEIAESLGLSENDINLAHVIGLVHDYGRFDQIERYHSFDDVKTIDHGEHGANLLIERGLINEYDVDVSDHEIVRKAVRNHNKLSIEEGLNDKELLMSKIIRDADKLDILYLISKKIIEVPQGEFTKEAIEDLKEMKSVDVTHMKNSGDKHLLNLGLIYDLNYEYSFKLIENGKYLDGIVNLHNNAEIEQIEKNIMEYVYKRGENYE